VKKIFYLYNYFIYRSKAINEHGVHSPFVFDLLTNVIYNNNDYYCFKGIESVREQLLDSEKTIQIIKNNPGDTNKIIEKKVYQIARQHSKFVKQSQLLFRLVNRFQPAQIIELGTSFGINTAYMSSVASNVDVITIEENEEIAEIAKQNFEKLKLKNIDLKIGSIKTFLPKIVKESENLFFVNFDENHCKQETLNYFYRCLEKADESSVFVFNNMNLSSEMKEVWDEIKNNIRVTVTLDLFVMGIVFFRKEQVKQHFVIKF